MTAAHYAIGILAFVLATAGPGDANATIKAAPLCRAKKDLFSKAKKNSITVDQMIRSVVSAEDDVVFLGVEHGNFERELYPKLVELIQSEQPRSNCFFVEESVSEEEARVISDFNEGVEGSDEKIKSRFAHYFEFFRFLRKNQLDIHYVDFPGKDSMSLENHEDSLRWLNVRDEFMAMRISDLKKSGKCQVAIFPIGLSHLVKAKRRIDLKSRLVDLGIRSSEILLLVSGRNSATQRSDYQYPTINAGLVWFRSPAINLTPSADILLCPEIHKISVEPYAFLNPPSQVPIAYIASERAFVGTFGEFQGTLIYSCQKGDCQNENKVIENSLRNQNVRFY